MEKRFRAAISMNSITCLKSTASAACFSASSLWKTCVPPSAWDNRLLRKGKFRILYDLELAEGPLKLTRTTDSVSAPLYDLELAEGPLKRRCPVCSRLRPQYDLELAEGPLKPACSSSSYCNSSMTLNWPKGR